MKNLKCALVIIVFSMGVFAQRSRPTAPPAPKAVKTGTSVDISELIGAVKDRTYTNKFFGFELNISPELTILDRPQQKLYSDAGLDMIKSKSKDTRQLEAAVNRTISLLAISKLPPGEPNNSAIEFATTKQPAGVTPKMVLAATSSAMTSTGYFTMVANLPSKKFGNFTFVGADFESTSSVPLEHRVYITMQKGYALMVTITVSKDAGFIEFDELLTNIKPLKK